MLFEAVIQAIRNFASLELWLIILAGLVIGFVCGIIPGISGMTALVLVLPFVFKMSPLQALPLMMAIMATQFQGGAISAILLNLPGTPGSAATLLDGFAMSQKGEAGRALGAAQMASGLGNIITAFVALALIPLILPIIMAVRSADMVFIMLLGISFIAVLGTGSMVKGLISGGIGLLISFIGYQPFSGIARFTFGSLYLYDGIPLVAIGLGLFALPEMIALASKGGTIARSKIEIKGMADVWRGVKDVFQHWTLVLRSNIIGFIIGIIPALGASSATFIAYGQAKQTSKHSETFGKGNVEGVIAPESANNACEAGALLTTLALGVPGSAIMALLIGAILMLGLTPGPEMMTRHLDLSLTLIWVISVTGVIALALYLPLCPLMAGITMTPGRILVPLVLVITFIGAFATQEIFNDVVVTLVMGMVGLLMRRYHYNRPALFLAFILGGLFEYYFFIAIKVSGPLFFLRPISLLVILTTLIVILYGPVKNTLGRRKETKEPVVRLSGNTYIFVSILCIVLAIMVLSLMMEYFESKLMPLMFSGIVFVLASIGLWQEILAGKSKATEFRGASLEGEKNGEWLGYLTNSAWVAGFVLAIYLLGFLIAILLFVLFYMKRLGTKWMMSLIYAVLTTALIYGAFQRALGMDLYQGLFLTWLGG